MKISCLLANLIVLMSGSGLAVAQQTTSTAQNGTADWEQSGTKVASIKDWFKSPADKASDADKIAFLKQEGALTSDMVDSSGQLTDAGNAEFNRLKSVYNTQYNLLNRGYQIISAEDGRKLQTVQTIVDNKILGIQNQCQENVNLQSNSCSSMLICDFDDTAGYVEKSGNTYFASSDGLALLQVIK